MASCSGSMTVNFLGNVFHFYLFDKISRFFFVCHPIYVLQYWKKDEVEGEKKLPQIF